jgi:hypothetical protein
MKREKNGNEKFVFMGETEGSGPQKEKVLGVPPFFFQVIPS